VKLGVVSDVHNNVLALQYALDHLRECAMVLSLGDLVSEYRVSTDILQLARTAGLIGIRGNHEKTILLHPGSTLRHRLDLDDLAYLAELPPARQLTIQGRQVTVAHGAPWDDPHDYRCEYIFPNDASRVARLRNTPADVILLGHTHVPMALKLDRCLVLNPGSCGEARTVSQQLTFAELDFDSGTASIFAIHPDGEPEPVQVSDF
jgi:putative phosphoesterase